MFLTKKAEELFDSILRQAKKALDKEPKLEAKGEDLNEEDLDTANAATTAISTAENKTPEEKMQELAKQITTGTNPGTVAKALVGVDPAKVAEVQKISDTAKEIAQNNKLDKEANNPKPQQNTEGQSTELPEEHGTIGEDLNSVNIPGDNKPSTTEELVDGTGDANESNDTDPLGIGASFLEQLHKKAEELDPLDETDPEDGEPVKQNQANESEPLFENDAYYVKTVLKGADSNQAMFDIPTVKRTLIKELYNYATTHTQEPDLHKILTDIAEGKMDADGITEIINIAKSGVQPTASLDTAIAKKSAFLKEVMSYTPETPSYEKVIQLAKSSSDSYDFLKKIAAELDEQPAGKQYPGQKQFDNAKTVSFSDGNTPKYPSQQLFSTRDGGNGTVVTLFPDTKPEVDVYADKKGRENLVKIKDGTDVTIAFVQPIGDIVPGFDYKGFITGSESLNQKGKAPAPQAVAGHEAMSARDYNDKVVEFANKPAQQAGIKPANAGLTTTITKKASDDSEYGGETSKEKKQLDDFEIEIEVVTSGGEDAEDKTVSIYHNHNLIGTASYVGSHVSDNELALKAVEDISDPQLKESFKASFARYDNDLDRLAVVEEEDKQQGSIQPTSGFNFSGLKKKSSDEININISSGGTDNDSNFSGADLDLSTGKNNLQVKEVAELHNKMKEKEAGMECASSFVFFGKKASQTDNPEELVTVITKIQETAPEGFKTLQDSANTKNKETFKQTLEQQITANESEEIQNMSNLLTDENIDYVLENVFGITKEEPKEEETVPEESEENKEKPGDKKQEEKPDDESGDGEDTLKGLFGEL